MRTNRYLPLLAAAILAAGCAENGSEPEVPYAPGGEITFNIGFSADGQNAPGGQTRVTTAADLNSSWENGDEIGIFAVTHGQTLAATASDNYIHNVRLTYSSENGGTWTPATPLHWPGALQGIASLDFYAYYPYDGEADPTEIGVTVSLDQTGAGYNAGELLMAKADNDGAGFGRSTTPVPLAFTHALAMVQVTLDNLARVLDHDDIAVTLRGARPSATLNLATGAIATDESEPTTDIAMHRLGTPDDLVFRALIPAQTLPQGTSLFHITDGENIFLSPFLAASLSLQAAHAEKFSQLISSMEIKNARITWGNGRYVLTTDPHDAGLYFKYGSVVGIFSDHHTNMILPGENNIDHYDVGDVAWSPVDVTDDWFSIPKSPYVQIPKAADHTVEKVKAGLGDMCRLVGLDLDKIKNTDADLLTRADIDNGIWRLPTRYENELFLGFSFKVVNNWSPLDGVIGHMFPNEDTFLPAAGYRFAAGTSTLPTGTVINQGYLGHYATTYAYGPTETTEVLRFQPNMVWSAYPTTTEDAVSVRCVRGGGDGMGWPPIISGSATTKQSGTTTH